VTFWLVVAVESSK